MTQSSESASAMRHELVLADEEASVSLGLALGRAAADGGTVFLEGILGAGKTTLCRGVLRAFGYQGAVKSPTYTLVEIYDLAPRKVYHFDLYRLGDPEELEYVGIRDYFSENNLCLIEWPERGAGFLPAADLRVKVSIAGAGRNVQITAHTTKGRAILTRLQNLLPRNL